MLPQSITLSTISQHHKAFTTSLTQTPSLLRKEIWTPSLCTLWWREGLVRDCLMPQDDEITPQWIVSGDGDDSEWTGPSQNLPYFQLDNGTKCTNALFAFKGMKVRKRLMAYEIKSKVWIFIRFFEIWPYHLFKSYGDKKILVIVFICLPVCPTICKCHAYNQESIVNNDEEILRLQRIQHKTNTDWNSLHFPFLLHFHYSMTCQN